jgi:RAD51-like protein 1
VALAACPEPQTAAQLLAKRATEAHHLAFGLPPLDDALRGGAPAGCITELVGQAGLGKTQLCKQLAAAATLPVLHGGMAGSVIYIDTEAKFSAARLVEIARGRWPARFADDAAVEALTRAVMVITPASAQELLTSLEGLEGMIIERGAKLVVVDSVAGALGLLTWHVRMCADVGAMHVLVCAAALVRAEFGRGQLAQRQAALGAQAARLKALAEAFRIPIVVTNQVTAVREPTGFGDAAYTTNGSGSGGDMQTAAALGTKWAHDVNTRIALDLGHAGERLLTVRTARLALLSCCCLHADVICLNSTD